MKKLFLALISMIFALSVSAQTLAYKGFSGGMMLHAGYVSAAESKPLFDGYQSMTKGIGGAARLHFGEHFRVGGEGFVSTANYDENASYVSLGWGGVLADYAVVLDKWTLYAGACFGGGAVQHLQRGLPLENDFLPDAATNYRHYTTLLTAPYIGVEYALNDGIHLTAKVDYSMPLAGDKAAICDFPIGPRLYVGFLFYRMKP